MYMDVYDPVKGTFTSLPLKNPAFGLNLPAVDGTKAISLSLIPHELLLGQLSFYDSISRTWTVPSTIPERNAVGFGMLAVGVINSDLFAVLKDGNLYKYEDCTGLQNGFVNQQYYVERPHTAGCIGAKCNRYPLCGSLPAGIAHQLSTGTIRGVARAAEGRYSWKVATTRYSSWGSSDVAEGFQMDVLASSATQPQNSVKGRLVRFAFTDTSSCLVFPPA